MWGRMAVLVARDNLEEERRLSLEVFGYSVDLGPVCGRESELVTPLEEGGKGVAEVQDFIETVRHLAR